MIEFFVKCVSCGKENKGFQNKPSSFICQTCGSSSRKLVVSENYLDDIFVFKCCKCSSTFTAVPGKEVTFTCKNPRCNNQTFFLEDSFPLSNISNAPRIRVDALENKRPPIDLIRRKISGNSLIKARIAIPYYSGVDRVDLGCSTWIRPETVFIITDKNTIPPGWGVCHQIFTEKNAKDEGVGSKTKPFILDIMKKLLIDFPDEDYYGFFNSDTILPPGSQIYDLIPSDGKDIVFHHRRNVAGKSLYEMTLKSQVFTGKDGFVIKAETLYKVIKGLKDMIIGSATWDDGMVMWCWQNIGRDKVELRYGSIYHPIHPQEWNSDEAGTRYNRKRLIESGVNENKRIAFNWFNVGEDKPYEKKSPKFGIIQPGRIGDILIVLPIAKWYHDKGYEILWPIITEYIPLFEYIPYVQAIDIGNSISKSYVRSIDALREREVDQILDLGIGFGRNEKEWQSSKMSFDEWKYKEAKVPFEERFNLQIVRKFSKEVELQKKLDLFNRKNYTFSHSYGSKGYTNFGDSNSVEFQIIDGYTIFDWITVIENASHVYCTDSCFAHLVNQLGLAKGRRTFKLLDNFDYKKHPGIAPKVNWEGDNTDTKEKVPEKQSSPVSKDIPVHFFTIVLNGMPFIRYHIKLLESLPFKWHWHIVEGVAELKHCTQWSLMTGGHIEDSVHCRGRSKDGTSEYLDLLEDKYKGKVTVYRKPEGVFWDGKVEMVNAPIPNLPSECILWEIDVDEFWQLPEVCKVVDMFKADSEKMGAFVYCYHFVGPNRYVSSMNTWGTMPGDWLRIFRFKKGFKWNKHEPPTLVDKKGIDQARRNFFSREDTLLNDVFFQHFAYVTREQLAFKESYYGYKDAVKHWEKLQESNGSEVRLKDYFPWVKEGTMAKVWDKSTMGEILFPKECPYE